MVKHLITLLLALFLAADSWSQDSEESSDTESEVAEVAEVAEEEEDESDLDEQGFEQEDQDDFTPSQEVSADQSLAFPVDI